MDSVDARIDVLSYFVVSLNASEKLGLCSVILNFVLAVRLSVVSSA